MSDAVVVECLLHYIDKRLDDDIRVPRSRHLTKLVREIYVKALGLNHLRLYAFNELLGKSRGELTSA